MANQHTVPIAVPIDLNTAMVIPERERISDSMYMCFSLRKTVQFLSAVDIFFGLLYSIGNPWFIFPAFIGIIGYIGANKYNSCYTLSYLVYTIVDWILKLGLYIYLVSDPIHPYNASAFSWIIVILSTLIGIWISKIVFQFWRSLRNLSLFELQTLKETKNIKYRMVYW
jgi:hypothetical protein